MACFGDEYRRVRPLERPATASGARRGRHRNCQPLGPGTCLNDFRFITELGSGSSGTAYKVRSCLDGNVYVIKRIRLRSEEQQRAAMKEVQLLGLLRHRNVIEYHTSFVDDGAIYIVMEYAEGGDMQQLIHYHRQHKASRHTHAPGLPEDLLWRFAAQMALALDHLHRHGIIHRDIKPLNVFLDISQNIKIGDLGVSKLCPDQDFLMNHTHVGTPLYLAPEQVQGRYYDEKVDIWSLGCLLYLLSTLETPFQGSNLFSLGQAISKKRHKPLPTQYSPDWCAMVDRLLQKNPSDRPSAADVLQAIPPHLLIQLGVGHTSPSRPPARRGGAIQPPVKPTPTRGSHGDIHHSADPLEAVRRPATPAEKELRSEHDTIAVSSRAPNSVASSQSQNDDRNGRDGSKPHASLEDTVDEGYRGDRLPMSPKPVMQSPQGPLERKRVVSRPSSPPGRPVGNVASPSLRPMSAHVGMVRMKPCAASPFLAAAAADRGGVVVGRLGRSSCVQMNANVCPGHIHVQRVKRRLTVEDLRRMEE
ncbi:unnamed protein product [Vitrella brassicaformis CCMP3155]|uniref:non-specific serine/threonine protein kinase n=1 Tax=Vitrella brassicaformis (strain CCMP3155) TaxID=1169540 RepID=A0A0G4EDE9_VITBC|nr:unnamed protein product [Vitrella brassicaformis CCMP3155]|eukprot:CEL93730.1 unnamed protein product [Vitrella brassicaformis CCMP3155]